MEIWKVIPGYSKYTISTLGNIKNNKNKIIKHQNNINAFTVILVCINENNGYYSVNSGTKTYKVHRLVYSVFKNISLNEMQNLVINHIDEDKSNNDINNLELVTQAENVMHSSIHNYKNKFI